MLEGLRHAGYYGLHVISQLLGAWWTPLKAAGFKKRWLKRDRCTMFSIKAITKCNLVFLIMCASNRWEAVASSSDEVKACFYLDGLLIAGSSGSGRSVPRLGTALAPPDVETCSTGYHSGSGVAG